ncbi:serine/threonine-protein kinase [Myxococcota bacterium]
MRACATCGKTYDDAIEACADDGTPLGPRVSPPSQETPQVTTSPPPPAPTQVTTPPPAEPPPRVTYPPPAAQAPPHSAAQPSPTPTATTDMDGPPPGTVLGTYRLLEILGEGGMGHVYLAEHTRLGRKVALKLLRSDLAANPKAASRFFSEARAVNQINHENIIQITDFIDDQGPEKYYIMEFLHGESLATVERCEGAVPTNRLTHIAIQVSNALAAVHNAGMVHRDLKPENIFLIERGGGKDFVKLLDFGVVKLGNLADATATGNTAAGAILGTPEYMSPEQVSSNPVDHRTDIYALGVILFEAVTGRKPFVANSFGEMVVNHLTVKPPKPSSLKDLPQPIPPKLETLILRCLAKDRDNRPQRMEDVERKLQEILVDLPKETEASPQRSGSRWLAGLVVGFAMVVVAGVAVVATRPTDPIRTRDKAVTQSPARLSLSQQVEVAFDSEPPGAEVFREGWDAPLGMTPFSILLARSEVPKTFRFELAGHEPAIQKTTLAGDTRLSIKLGRAKVHKKRMKARWQGKSKKKMKSPARRGTINPFD